MAPRLYSSRFNWQRRRRLRDSPSNVNHNLRSGTDGDQYHVIWRAGRPFGEQFALFVVAPAPAGAAAATVQVARTSSLGNPRRQQRQQGEQRQQNHHIVSHHVIAIAGLTSLVR